MAKLSFWLDKRARQDGTHVIKFRIYHQSTFYISSDIAVLPDSFSDGQITGASKKAKLLNAMLRKKYDIIDRMLLDLEDKNMLRSMNDKSLKTKLASAISNRPVEQSRFVSIIERYIKTLDRPNTVDTYRLTLKKINTYDKTACFATMTADWLTGFDTWMQLQGLALNSRSIMLRNIRTVFNFAIDNEWTELYPFRRFKIRQEVTKQECHLSTDQLRELLNAKVESCYTEYVDIFMLMMYLCGINAIDLLANPTTRIENGRLLYTRSKTSKKYSIKIEPEAQALLNRYMRKSSTFVGFLRVTTAMDYRAYMASMNRGLKKLCRSIPPLVGTGKKLRDGLIIEPQLSANWARHTFATLAISIGIPKDHVSLCLGHSIGARITDVYIDYAEARKNIDEANRKVIDYINQLRTTP